MAGSFLCGDTFGSGRLPGMRERIVQSPHSKCRWEVKRKFAPDSPEKPRAPAYYYLDFTSH